MGMGNLFKKLGSKKSRSFKGKTTPSSNEPSSSEDPANSVSEKINAAKKKYALIPDRFSSLDQVFFFVLSQFLVLT